MEDIYIRKIDLSYPEEVILLQSFLVQQNLRLESDIEVAFGAFDLDNKLVACGAASGFLLKCFAVDSSFRGQNLLGPLVSALTQERFATGHYNLSIITRASNEMLFYNCGFNTVVRTKDLVMLENQVDGPAAYAQPFFQPGDEALQVGAVVMNCNPFTLGHRHLVEYAAKHCDVLHLFVVETDRSAFPTSVRLRLVQEGTADIPNVRVHLSGRYIISSATFPTYFLKADEDAAAMQSQLDVTLFAERIAPVLCITKRFVGQEPLDRTTARYNVAMRAILPFYNISLIEIPRLSRANQIISASSVRQLIQEKGVCPEVLALVPPTTQRYLLQEFRGNL